ncbi:O-antigen ligase family protein [Glutamicibacter arilaitensis]|uniref:O-antigen ligase family protein n=1 Tax=Glutamicibacter arilaitensis TaxID=256701 RepID=UPI00384E9CC0
MIADPLILITASVLGLWAVGLICQFPGFGIALTLISFLLTAMQLPLVFDPRTVLVGVTILHFSRNLILRQPLFELRALRPFLVPSLVLCSLMVLSIAWSEAPAESLGAAIGYASVLLFLVIHSRYLSTGRSQQIVTGILSILMITSMLAVLAGLPFAFLGDRARGLTSNPNAFGIFAVFWLSVSARASPRILFSVWAISLTAIVMAASRASLVAAVVVIAVIIFYRLGSRFYRVLAIFVLSVVTGWFLVYGFEMLSKTTDAKILRTNNSRTDEVSQAIDIFQSHLWLGGGAGAYMFEPGSMLKLAAELGLLGMLVAAVLIPSYLVRTSADFPVRAAVIGSVVNASIEGWLFTGGSVFLLFLLVLVAGARSPRSKKLSGALHIGAEARK